MVFDHAGIQPNRARDRTHVKLPREEPEEFSPPTAAHVAAVYRLIPAKHRLPLLFLDWSGARVAAIDLTLVGDYDEARRRVRLRAQTTKTRRAHWIELPPVLAEALEASLAPREDRDPEARLFAASGADALRVHRQGLPGARHPILLTARPAASEDQPAPPLRRARGADRRIRRATEPEDDGRDVRARHAR
jgi:hypothetical protein